MLDFLMKTADERVEIARTNIRVAASLRRMNLAEIAREAGLSRNAVSQFVSGRTQLSYQNMLRVCDVIGVPIGLMHIPDTMTEGRIRLHKTLMDLPPHLLQEAFASLSARPEE